MDVKTDECTRHAGKPEGLFLQGDWPADGWYDVTPEAEGRRERWLHFNPPAAQVMDRDLRHDVVSACGNFEHAIDHLCSIDPERLAGVTSFAVSYNTNCGGAKIIVNPTTKDLASIQGGGFYRGREFPVKDGEVLGALREAAAFHMEQIAWRYRL